MEEVQERVNVSKAERVILAGDDQLGRISRRIEAFMSNRIALRPEFAKRVALVIAGVAAQAAPAIIGVMNAPALRAQDQPSARPAGATRPRFEVASVKPSVLRPPTAERVGGRVGGGGCPQSLKMDPGRVDIECATLTMLIGYPELQILSTS